MPHDPYVTATVTPNPLNEFRDRCRALGLSFWHCDASGSIADGPVDRGLVGLWLGSSALCAHIERTARFWLNTDTPTTVELVSGCWLLPVRGGLVSDQRGITVVLVLGKTVLDTEWFEVICAAAALAPTEASSALAPWMRYGKSDLDYLAKILRWSRDDLAKADLNRRAIDEFSEKLIHSYEEAHLLFKLARFMNQVSEPAQMMQAACGQIQQVLPFRWIAIQFNDSSAVADDLAGALFLTGDLPCDRHTFQTAVDQLLKQQALDDWTRLLEPDQSSLAAMVGSEIVFDPISHDREVVGGLLAGNKQGADPDVGSVETQFLDAIADFLSVFHQNISRFAEQRSMFMGTLQAMTASIDAKDPYTRGHSDRVALLGARLAAATGMQQEQVERVRIAGLVHDVGK